MDRRLIGFNAAGFVFSSHSPLKQLSPEVYLAGLELPKEMALIISERLSNHEARLFLHP